MNEPKAPEVSKAERPRRARVPPVGDTVSEEGTPSLRAWSSALTLADLQAAMQRADLRRAA